MLEMLDELPTGILHLIMFIIMLSCLGLLIKLMELNKPERHTKIIGIMPLAMLILWGFSLNTEVYEYTFANWKDIFVIFCALFWIYMVSVLIQHIAFENVRYKQNWILYLIKEDYIKNKDHIKQWAEELTNEESEQKAIIYFILLTAMVMPMLYLGYYILKNGIYIPE